MWKARRRTGYRLQMSLLCHALVMKAFPCTREVLLNLGLAVPLSMLGDPQATSNIVFFPSRIFIKPFFPLKRFFSVTNPTAHCVMNCTFTTHHLF